MQKSWHHSTHLKIYAKIANLSWLNTQFVQDKQIKQDGGLGSKTQH